MKALPGFNLPVQLRYQRAWYGRNAHWHERRARDSRVRYRDWHREQARDYRDTALRIVERYRATGRFDRLLLCSVRDALARMRNPRWLTGADIIHCPKCFDVRIGQCENCQHNYARAQPPEGER